MAGNRPSPYSVVVGLHWYGCRGNHMEDEHINETGIDDNLALLQCGKCGKWRKLPHNVDEDDLPDDWECQFNKWDPDHADCSAPQV